VCLIDNGSTDGSVEFVHRTFPTVKVVANPTNLGFPEAYNRAITKVAREYIVLLNSDTEIRNYHWLEHLVSAADEDNDVAAVACKMVSMQDHQILLSVGGMGIPFWRGFVDIGMGEIDVGQYSEKFEPFAFCGGAALLRRSAFLEVGGFDDLLFLYLEDADISWRLRMIGRTITFAPEAVVAHIFSATFSGVEVNEAKLYFCHRNLLRSIVKNCGSSLRWALWNYFAFTLLILLGFAVLEPRKALAISKGLIWNVRFLRRTIADRIRVQSRRIVDDQALLNIMYPKLPRHQSTDHARLRHIFDILFSKDQRLPH
jgi:hypothetical protein